ncbi:MAG: glycosyltransferase family 4 protein [Acidobacteriota bacterium]
MNDAEALMNSTNKKRLLILTSSFPNSKTDETCAYIREFAERLAAEFAVTVFAPNDARAVNDSYDEFQLVRPNNFIPSRFEPMQASRDLNELVSQNLFNKILLLVSLTGFFLRAFVLALRADVICSHWLLPSGMIGAVIARALNKPHLLIEHSGALHWLRGQSIGRWLAKFMVDASSRVVVVSRDLQEKLLALYPQAKGKIELIPMGISVPAFAKNLALNQSAKIRPSVPGKILFIGRLVEIKGLTVLLKALADLPHIQLLIAGEGEQKNNYKSLAGQLNLNAEFLGQVGRNEKRQLLAACDAVVIPSMVLPGGRTEGVPVVMLEAMAAGVPVIASNVGGLAEIIVDAESGLLFEAGNSERLAEKINHLIAHRELQRRLSVNARQLVEAYDWQIVGSRFTEMINHILRMNGSVASYTPARKPNA